jgi:hypothetical protein
MRWHYRMGHPRPDAFNTLVDSTKGVKTRGPTTVEYEACALAKIKKQNRRMPRAIEEAYGERIAMDFHPYAPGINGYTS